MKKLLFIPAILTSFLFLQSCSKSTECEDSVKAKIIDMTGLDGCGWMIELNDGTRLEPVNLSSFDIEPKDGKKIWVSYAPSTILIASICMAGEMVEISCISER